MRVDEEEHVDGKDQRGGVNMKVSVSFSRLYDYMGGVDDYFFISCSRLNTLPPFSQVNLLLWYHARPLSSSPSSSSISCPIHILDILPSFLFLAIASEWSLLANNISLVRS